MDLYAIAIVLDFMQPLVALGSFGLGVANCCLMNPGMSERFGTREAHK